jgi:hypothetical protein
MDEKISAWEGEGGSVSDPTENKMTGTENQILWATQIRTRVDAEFDRVAAVLRAAAARQSSHNRMNTEAMIGILEEKRAEVMANPEAGYFIQDWQELSDQVRRMLVKDERYAALKTGREPVA